MATLREELRTRLGLTAEQATRLHRLIAVAERRGNGAAGVRDVLEAADEMLGTCGVEFVGYPGEGGFDYCNNGDRYEPTLGFCSEAGGFVICSWGDAYEEAERRYAEETGEQRCPNCGEWSEWEAPDPRYRVRFVAHCGMTTMDEAGLEPDEAEDYIADALAEAKERGIEVVWADGADHGPIRPLLGKRYEMLEPEDCALVPDDAGILSSEQTSANAAPQCACCGYTEE